MADDPLKAFVEHLTQRAASGQLAKDVVHGIRKVERILNEGPSVLREMLGPAPPPPPEVPNVLVTLPQSLSAEAVILHRDLQRLEKLDDPGEQANLVAYLESALWGLKDRCDRLAEKLAEWERDAKRR